MERLSQKLIACCQHAPAQLPWALQALMEVAQGRLPQGYVNLMAESNGYDGFVDVDQYLIVWPASEVLRLNEAYFSRELAAGLILFGTDGLNTGFAFDLREPEPTIVSIPLDGMSLTRVVPRGRTFVDFLEALRGPHS
jgi:hypothetical protein